MNGGVAPPGDSSTASTSTPARSPQRQPSANAPSFAQRSIDAISRDAATYAASRSSSDGSSNSADSILPESKSNHLRTQVTLSDSAVSRKKHHARHTQW